MSAQIGRKEFYDSVREIRSSE